MRLRRGQAPGAVAGSGVQGLIPCGEAPARCTSWSARSARPLPAPSVLSPSAPTPAPQGLRASGAYSPAPSAPVLSDPVLDSPGPHPPASPLCFCQRGSPTPSPLPQCAAPRLRRRGAARENAAGAHPGAAAPTLAQLLAGRETRGPAGCATRTLQPPGCGRRRGQCSAWEGLRQGRRCRGAPGRYRFKCT